MIHDPNYFFATLTAEVAASSRRRLRRRTATDQLERQTHHAVSALLAAQPAVTAAFADLDQGQALDEQDEPDPETPATRRRR